MGFVPHPQEGAKRFAQPEFRESHRTQPFQYPARELLEIVDLVQDSAAVFAYPVRVRRTRLRKPHQGAGVDPQGKQIRSKLVMQFTRDLLAFDVLQRYGALGE